MTHEKHYKMQTIVILNNEVNSRRKCLMWHTVLSHLLLWVVLVPENEFLAVPTQFPNNDIIMPLLPPAVSSISSPQIIWLWNTWNPGGKKVWFGLVWCCLMAPDLSKDICCRVWPTFSELQITRSDIRPHIKWAVSLVIAYGQFNFPYGFMWRYMG